MCTSVRFTDDKGNMYLGRNLDWNVGYGQHIVVTPRNATIPSPYLGTIKPKYACIGTAIVLEDRPLYFDAGNEAGVAVAGLNFAGYCGYESGPVEGKTNLAAYEFPVWVVANFGSVEEVKSHLGDVAIVSKAINDTYPVAELHWIIGDKEQSIVVEYTPDGMKVYDNDLDVLTNQPDYHWHHENVRNYLHISNGYPGKTVWTKDDLTPFSSGSTMMGLPGGFDPASRFVRAAFLNAHYPVQSGETDNVARLFHTLGGVAMAKGGASMSNGDFEITLYTGGYSAATKTYYYNTYGNPALISASLDDFDLDSEKLIDVEK